jgi:hypothetical protein
LPAQRVLQLAEDKVIRLVDADLARALIEIPALRGPLDASSGIMGPVGCWIGGRPILGG